jgi:L-ascorbate metabolism protein UlaG (beta-lactamase superfamily)
MQRPRTSNRRRLVARICIGIAAVGALAAAAIVADAWPALGGRANGARRKRMEHSPEWRDGHFVNPQPLWNDIPGSLTAMTHPSRDMRPSTAIPVVHPTRATFASPPRSGLRVTWLGHSSTIIEIDGTRILTDPVWGKRASPLEWAGPSRWYAPPVPIDQLPPIDAVVISHDHYDHLDLPTIRMLSRGKATFIVPLGLGAHLASWGVPEHRIVELDWWQHVRIGSLEITATPARHASGRGVLDKDATLWAGFAFVTAKHRVYYSGDTGLFPAMLEIGQRLGPFDLSMIEIGQYNRAWPDWHIGPEQALIAQRLVRSRLFLPVHWGLFSLAPHGWTEPIERVLAAAKPGDRIVVPRPGQSFEPATPPPIERWWPHAEWKSAAEDPIVSTKVAPIAPQLVPKSR